jgi:hypothetical protein
MTRFHRPLLAAGLAQFAALLAVLVAMLFDDRAILGINPWIKPSKFLVSVGIYLVTMAWMVQRVRGRHRSRQIVAWGILVVMVLENAAILTQAARGTTSHFNVATAFDAFVFNAMGIMIGINTALVAWLLVLFLRSPEPMPRAMLTGIRLGLVLFLVGGLEGGMMVAASAHSVGVPDGGPGLPYVNWSTEGGDLRSAHFVGLHALQALPILGWLVRRKSPAAGVAIVRVAAVIWAAVFAGLTWMAISGVPLYRATL